MDHISELEAKSKKGEELKNSQKEAIAKKQEVQDLIDDNDRILSIYFEAYSKREENEPNSPLNKEKKEKEENKEKELPKEEPVEEKEVIIYIIHSLTQFFIYHLNKSMYKNPSIISIIQISINFKYIIMFSLFHYLNLILTLIYCLLFIFS